MKHLDSYQAGQKREASLRFCVMPMDIYRSLSGHQAVDAFQNEFEWIEVSSRRERRRHALASSVVFCKALQTIETDMFL